MKATEKTKRQLIDELADMHKKVSELETLVIQHEQRESATRSEGLFKTVIENALEFVTIIDGDGIIRYESPSVERKTGYRLEDLVGKRIFDIIHPDDLPEAMDLFNRTIQNPDKIQFVELHTKDSYGMWRIVEAGVRNLLNNPIVKGIVIHSHDITEHRQIERQLRESENLYRTLAENSLTGIYLFRERRYLFANEMFSKISGYSWDDLKFMDPMDLIAPEYRNQALERVKRRLDGEDVPPDYETQILRKDGAIRDVHIKATRIMFEGEPAVLGNIIDTTERRRMEEALRQNEVKYRRLHETMMDAFVNVDMAGRIQEANLAYQAMVGYSEEELRQLTFMDLTPEKWHAFEGKIVQEKILVQGHSEVYEKEYRRKGGTIFPVELRTFLMRDDGGNPVGMWAIVRDITERKRAEEALRDSERRLKIILQGSPISAFILDREHRVIHWNKALEELSGMKAEKVIGTKEHWKPFYRDERPCLADLLIDGRVEEIPQWYPGKWAESKLVEEAYEATDFFTALGEGGRWMQFTAATIRDFSAKIVGVIETLEDITERKQAEDRLRESESRFRDLVENSLTGIYIMQDGQIVYKNSEQDRIFGPLSQPHNFNDFRNIHPEDAEKVKNLYEKMMSGKISYFDVDMRFFPCGEMDDTADIKWVQSRAREIEYQGRKAILINMMDVTRTRELEHLMRIDDKMTSLGRAAAGIIHELRNPLSGINVYLTALKKIYNQPEKIESESLEKVDEIIEKMQSASNKIESVIKRVMDFSKPSIPKLALTDINYSIQEAVGLSSATLRKYGIRIETSFRDDLPQCFTDSHLIGQVLLNLIMNASQAMEKTKGEKIIEVTTSVEGNAVLVGVADSGPGVPPVLRKKIFDPFFTTKKDSSGIGLSVCYRIMADHGGSLNVLTSKWGGAEFRVEIPIEKRKGIR